MIWIQYVFLSSVFPLKFGCSDLEEPAQNFFPRLSINEYPSARQSGRVHERQRRVRRVLERLCECVWVLCGTPGHTRRNTKSHCPRAIGSSLRKPSQWQGRGSVELIRPLGLALRQQFLLLILGDSPHIRTKRDKVSLKVFPSPCSSPTFGSLLTAEIHVLDRAASWRLSLKCK